MRNLLAALFLSLASPALAQQASTGTFVHLTGRAWQTLDPANASDAVSALVVGNVYETLITFKSLDEPGVFEPFLSTAVPAVENGLLSPDGLVYRFPIRKGVRFHDGSTLTPEDVRYSLLRFMLLDSEGGPAALLLEPLLGVYATRDAAGKPALDIKAVARAISVEGDDVVVRLRRPNRSFLALLASLPVVTSRAWAVKRGDWDGRAATWKAFNGTAPGLTGLHAAMNGTGPFQLETAGRDGLTLVRHAKYWRGPAALERVELRVVPNGALRLFLLSAGEADAGHVESSYRDFAKASKSLKVADQDSGRDLGEILFFGFKTDPAGNEALGSGALDGRGVPPDFFADEDVRRGFAWAFDYDAFFRSALGGRGRRAPGPIPPALLADQPEPAYRRDPAKAAAFLKKARTGEVWKKGFVVSVAYSEENLPRRLAAEALKSGLEGVNPLFQVRLLPLPSKEFYARLEARKLPLFIAGNYADYPDPHAYAFSLLHSAGYFPKYQGFSDAAMDALVEKAQAEPGDRAPLYRELSAAAAERLPQIYTFAPVPLSVCRDRVLGYDSRQNVNDLAFNGFPYFYAYSKRPGP